MTYVEWLAVGYGVAVFALYFVYFQIHVLASLFMAVALGLYIHSNLTSLQNQEPTDKQ
jgi:hypothetical protein